MNDQGLLQLLVAEFQERGIPELIERDIHVPAIPNKVIAVIGMRRSGKTYFLYQQIRELLDNDIDPTQVLFLNFEDERLLPVSGKKLASLIEGFYSLYPQNHDRRLFVFLDEIQNVDDWPVVLRRFLDTKDVQFHISGSSARLLSKEIATSLRGRSISCEVLPFSYLEFLTSKGYSSPEPMMGPAAVDRGRKFLEEYLKRGGFPEAVMLRERERVKLLQDYVNVAIFRDIIERYKITNTSLVKYLIKTLISCSGREFTVNKFYNDLKSQGQRVGKNTIHEYLGYVNDAFLSFTIPIHTESIRKRQVNPRKVYSIDTGLVTAFSFAFGFNTGQLFENLVYLALRRKGYKIAYYVTRSGYEVDFVAQNVTGETLLLQAAAEMNDPLTEERERRALQEAEEELSVEGKLVTMKDYLSDPI